MSDLPSTADIFSEMPARPGSADSVVKVADESHEELHSSSSRGRIETTPEAVERIGEAVGFGDAENIRRAFIRIYGQPP